MTKSGQRGEEEIIYTKMTCSTDSPCVADAMLMLMLMLMLARLQVTFVSSYFSSIIW